MTKVVMDWKDLALMVSGHANHGPKGEDVVCAGISAITQALLNYMLDQERQKMIELSWFVKSAEGAMRIRAKPYGGHFRETKACFRMAVTGLRAIEQNYPGYIEIEEVKEDGNV